MRRIRFTGPGACPDFTESTSLVLGFPPAGIRYLRQKGTEA
jgi:hypothetical protein